MKRIFITIAVFCLSAVAIAQTTEAEKELKKQSDGKVDGWKAGGSVALNISQTSLSNWAAGGQSSVAVNGILNLYAQYRKGKGLWENYLELGYGSMKQEGNKKWWKTDDKIDFTTKYGYKLNEITFAAALANFKTQMAKGYNYPNDSVMVSKFMAPGYLLGAIGIDYKPNDKFSAFISPATTKITFVNDQDLANSGAYGVDAATFDAAGVMTAKGKKSRSEFGGYLRLMYKQNLMKNIDLQTKLELFSNYANNPQNIDVTWDVLISMKVNKFITATLSTSLIYDDDVDIVTGTDNAGNPTKGPRIQFKEVLQVGFSYKF